MSQLYKAPCGHHIPQISLFFVQLHVNLRSFTTSGGHRVKHLPQFVFDTRPGGTASCDKVALNEVE